MGKADNGKGLDEAVDDIVPHVGDGEETPSENDLHLVDGTNLDRFSNMKLMRVEIMQMASSPLRTINASYF